MTNNRAVNGGALSIVSKVNATIANCDFVNNTATLAGGAICTEYTNSIEITASTFKENFAESGGVAFFSDKITVKTNNITVKNNFAGKGIMYFIESTVTFMHNTTISDNLGSLIFYYSSVSFKGTTMIVHGVSKISTSEGGAITAFQSIVDFKGITNLQNNYAIKGGAIHAASSKLHMYGLISVSNNTASDSGGGIYLYQSEVKCNSMSILELFGNSARDRGGGILAISSTIISEYSFSVRESYTYTGSTVSLTSNVAMSFGGGICFENNAKLNVLKLNQNAISGHETALKFDGNIAAYGGALYVADDTTSGTCSASSSDKIHSTVTECFFQTSELQEVITSDSNMTPTKSVHTKFINNHAFIRGPNLFGGLLDRCTQSSFNEKRHNVTNGLEYLMLFTNINSLKSISSDPVQVCFCPDNTPNCSYQLPPIKVRKGETFTVPLVSVDQAGHTVSATIHSYPKSNESGIGEGQLIQGTADNCTNLTFNVFSPHNYEELIVYAEGPCKDAPPSQKKIHIKFETCDCSVGFQPIASDQTKCACECDTKLAGYVTECDYKTKTIVRGGNFWISFINATANFSDYLIYPHCPLDYCVKITMQRLK